MRWDLIPYLLPLVAAATLSGALAVIAWLHRRTPGAAAFMAIMLAVAEWALAYALEISADDLPGKVFWSGVAYTGLLVIPAAWLLMAARFTGRGIPGRGTLAALLVEPLLVLLCLWAEGAHGLVGTAFRLRPVGAVMTLDMTPGPVFWLNAIYSYALLLAGVLVAGGWVRMPADGRHVTRGQAALLLIGAGAPLVGSALLAVGSNPLLQFEPTPFAFALCGLALAWDLFAPRQRARAPQPAFAPAADTLAVIADVDLPHGRDLVEPLGVAPVAVAEAWPPAPAAATPPLPARPPGASAAAVPASGPTPRDLRITLHDREGNPIGRLVVLESAAAQRQAEEALRESEERFRLVFDESPIGMALASLDGNILKVNKVFCRLLESRPAELIGKSLAALTHPEDAGMDALLFARALDSALSSYRVEKRYVKMNGETLWADLTSVVLRDQSGQALYRLMMVEDLFERKRADLLEDERRHIAYELHDGLAQVVASVHQHLQAYAGHYRPRTPEARAELERVMDLAQMAVRETRRTIAGLRPLALDEYGLAAALRQEADLLRSDGWTIEFDDLLGGERLPPAIETALFRVGQESLANARKHAGTARARLSLRRENGATGPVIRLEIEDYGKGFDPSAIPTAGPGERVGLREIRDRVTFQGGRLTITTEPGSGTKVVAEVPLPRRATVPTTHKEDSSHERTSSVTTSS